MPSQSLYLFSVLKKICFINAFNKRGSVSRVNPNLFIFKSCLLISKSCCLHKDYFLRCVTWRTLFSSVTTFQACRTEYQFFRLHLPPCLSPFWLAYRNKPNQTKPVYSGYQPKFTFSLQQPRLTWMFLSPCVYKYTHIHTLASSEIVVTSFGSLLWPVPEALLPPDPADLPAPGHWLAEAAQPWCTRPGGLPRDLWLPRQSFNPISAPFLNWLHKLQTGLQTIASFPQKCHYLNKTETHSFTASSLHW